MEKEQRSSCVGRCRLLPPTRITFYYRHSLYGLMGPGQSVAAAAGPDQKPPHPELRTGENRLSNWIRSEYSQDECATVHPLLLQVHKRKRCGTTGQVYNDDPTSSRGEKEEEQEQPQTRLTGCCWTLCCTKLHANSPVRYYDVTLQYGGMQRTTT